MTYRDRRAARADRLRDWAEKREAKSRAAFDGVRRLADSIPFGQPILVGHHSEKHARKDQDRIWNGMSNGVEHEKKAHEMASKAAEIDRQAANAIYRDDHDELDRLREKLAVLEERRERMKTINKEIRKGAGWGQRITLSEDERADLERVARHGCTDKPGYPAYALSNLGGTISATRKRIVEAEHRQRVRETLDAGDPA